MPSQATASTAVYPRVCGGTSKQRFWIWQVVGLSPRVRGNHGRRAYTGGAGGSIPACAGEPLTKSSTRPASRGLSPRVRGNLRRRARPKPLQPVYPRVCGGTISCTTLVSSANGLSPRVRGNHVTVRLHPANHGSIPACAGEPVSLVLTILRYWVYPRVCGGTRMVVIGLTATQGLSPRVRGNPLDPDQAPRPGRSIPALCGGTTLGQFFGQPQRGLSPRVRGNRPASDRPAGFQGSIPACAGEPSYVCCEGSLPTVYPRVCGGTQ